MNLYDETCFKCSEQITNQYSTSFSNGIRAFDRRFQNPVFAIYGFVRCADEIVDTFHQHDKAGLLTEFKKATFEAIAHGISLNPVLHSFQLVVNQYGIERELIEAFLQSMATDLEKQAYTKEAYQTYIYGSAETVGLMCLRVFAEGDAALYERLLPAARSLGAAFQKVNFLRDVKSDFEERGRVYFPGIDFNRFTEKDKQQIEEDIRHDFSGALTGIRQLPEGARMGVYITYVYYLRLFKKISRTPANVVMQKRIRVSDLRKTALYIQAVWQQKLKLI